MTFENEHGRDINEQTGEHIQLGQLEFDAWAYQRIGSGYTVCIRQLPPQPMVDALGESPVTWWTVNYGGNPPFVTYQPFAEADLDAPRIPYDTLPDSMKELVLNSAGQGWIWDGRDHCYDPTTDQWKEACS
jgi:hypothetical protein